MFDESRTDWASERAELRQLLDAESWQAARRTTINAHYTGDEIVAAMWDALRNLGIHEGRVLEPGCGAGAFIGRAPQGVSVVGVELDPTTAAITQALYPGADVRAESFADSRFPVGHFDAAIGNVPFADVTLHDPVHNRGRHSMHNHFIVKALELTRPGGIVAVLTSTFTMDAQNPAARQEMQSKADLIGAVRLPAGTHRRSAGTEVVTDLLILRRRVDDQEPEPFTWEQVRGVDVDGHDHRVNEYFLDNPHLVLGELSTTSTQWRDGLTVVAKDLGRVDVDLRDALERIVAEAHDHGLAATAPTRDAAAPAAELTQLWDGTIVARSGGFMQAQSGVLQALKVPKTQTAELSMLLELRDRARQLLDAESRTLEGEEDFPGLRSALQASYDRYVTRFGPINRYTTRSTGRFVDVVDELGNKVIDPATGQPETRETLARIQPPAVRLLGADPFGPVVKALERFDEESQTASPAGLLRGRVVERAQERVAAQTPADALAIAMDREGRPTINTIAGLLDVSPADAREQLGTLVYDDPDGGGIVPAAEYLSGNVRVKLERAREAAAENPALQVNVDALTQAIPAPVPMSEIAPRMGAAWISAKIHEQFIAELLRDRSAKVESHLPGEWKVSARRYGVLATREWGTDRRPAPDIIELMLKQIPVTVTDTVDDGDRKREVFNPVETEAARMKADAIQERFEAWVWEDPDRATQLAAEYNRRFNSLVLRDYSSAGDRLSLPGLATSITLRPHQRAAVARMIHEPAVGLFHQVGAGKTLEMIVGATELRRLGLITKPLIVVPNHMLEQFSREWLHAYPNAKILAAGSGDLQKDQRRLFIAKAAANQWDGIIMTQSAFKTIGVSPDFEAEYIRGQVRDLEEAMDAARAADSNGSIKQIEKAKLRLEERLQQKLDMKRDPGVTFEAMGVDYLVVDEAHMYKNLTVPSKIPGAGKTRGSDAATDLDLKLELLRSRHGDRVVTMATATPLANSVTEAYVMQRYLRPDLLADAGVRHFDTWAATFGEVVSEIEMSPTGQFRLGSRFAKFQNVPELLKMFHIFADVKTAEDLDLDVPAIAQRTSDGKREPETVVLDPTPEQIAYITELGERADAIHSRRVSPSEDNMLKVSGDGRKAALDMKLIDATTSIQGAKLKAAADRIAAQWNQTRMNQYTDPLTGEPSPVRGGLQLVFCDLGTPKPGLEQFSAYTHLRWLLVQRGVPAEGVRFIHEAKNDTEKARMFAAARSGHISVLIGSTQKMGVGTNVQDRVTALHHIDSPWRPADVEQRDGRAIRQGNQNEEVKIYRYVVERTFDAYMWQTIARKAQFIAQLMRGRLDAREIEDIGDTALSANEAKALASGNPLILEQAEASNAYQKLHRQEIAYDREQAAMHRTLDFSRGQVDLKNGIVDQLQEAAARTVDVSGDHFHIKIGDRHYSSRTEAAEALQAWIGSNTWDWQRSETPVGTIGGHTILVRAQRNLGELRAYVTLQDVPLSGFTLDPNEIGLGDIRILENKTTGIQRCIDTTRWEIRDLEQTITEIQPRIGKPFPKSAEAAAAKTRLDDVTARIAKLSQKRDTNTEATLVDALGRPSTATRSPIDDIRHRAAHTTTQNQGPARRDQPLER